ncbi:MAG TPA: hypothetical protein VMX35_10145 [Acidobacteriota bacterium]|nr:hypothetical protein [Acidobacteriota bacterium]
MSQPIHKLLNPSQAALSILLITFLVIASPLATYAQDELISVEIRGTVITDDGVRLAGSELELRFTRITENESGLTQQMDERVAVTTDEAGFYSLKLNISRDWTNFVLYFNASRLDRVHYQQPRERQLTELIRTGIESGTFEFEVNWLIESRPRWSELRSRIDQFGENSAQGRLMRDYGLPEHEQELNVDNKIINIWFYYTQGFAVRFIDGERDKEFRFRPRNPQQR